jgi:hypothetical protein
MHDGHATSGLHRSWDAEREELHAADDAVLPFDDRDHGGAQGR